MFAAGRVWAERLLVVGRIVVVAVPEMGGSIRRLLAEAFGVVAVVAAAAVVVGSGLAVLVLALAAGSSYMGTPSAGEDLHCYNTASATGSVEETGHYNTAAAVDPEV